MRSEFLKYLTVLASISILTMYVEMVVLPSLPTIESQFHVSESEGSWVLSSETLSGMALAPVIGKLADLYGKKRVLLAILTVYTFSVLLTAVSPDYAVLILSRSVQGIGLSINPLAYTILRERLPDRELPVAQGVIASTFAVGAAVAIPIGSYIAEYYTWQVAYETAIPLLVFVIMMVSRVIPESTEHNAKEEVDVLGIALLSSALTAIGVSLTEAPTWGWLSLPTTTLLLVGAALLYGFVLHISRVDNPLIDPSDFRNPNVAVPLLSSFVTGFALFLTFQSLVFLFELPQPVGYGMTIFETGLTMAPISLVLLVAGPLFGSIVNRVGYKRVILSTSALSVVSIMALSVLIGDNLPVPELMAVLVVILFFTSGMNVTRITLLLASSSRKRIATITGTNTSMRLMGNTLGPVVAGSLESTFKTPILLFVYNGYPVFALIPSRLAFQYSFLVSSVIVIGVVILATKIREEKVQSGVKG